MMYEFIIENNEKKEMKININIDKLEKKYPILYDYYKEKNENSIKIPFTINTISLNMIVELINDDIEHKFDETYIPIMADYLKLLDFLAIRINVEEFIYHRKYYVAYINLTFPNTDTLISQNPNKFMGIFKTEEKAYKKLVVEIMKLNSDWSYMSKIVDLSEYEDGGYYYDTFSKKHQKELLKILWNYIKVDPTKRIKHITDERDDIEYDDLHVGVLCIDNKTMYEDDNDDNDDFDDISFDGYSSNDDNEVFQLLTTCIYDDTGEDEI